MPPVSISEITDVRCEASVFDQAFDSYASPLPILYQSGYLTIKDYNRHRDMYALGFPNEEVRKGFASCLFQYVTNTKSDNRARSVFLNAYYDFSDNDDLPAFIEAIRTFYAGIPYQLARDNRNEHYYHSLLYTLLVAFGADVKSEESIAKGQSDLTLCMPRGIYVLELKYDKSAEEALAQIDQHGYAEKYRLDGRPVTKVGIVFSSKERNITEWQAESL